MNTEKQLQAHLKTPIKTISYDNGLGTISIKEHAPWLACKDGFKMSVQASKNHYCQPREDKPDEYYAVEIGFPNREEPLIIAWAEDDLQPTDTVYGFVPIDIVCQVIEKHGGFKK